MLIKIDDNYAVEIKDLDQREYDMLKMCEQYEKNPFGAPPQSSIDDVGYQIVELY